MAHPTIKSLPKSERRYTFALTPLADAMFQLLIFFMLSTSLTPYSLLTITRGAGPAAALACPPSPTRHKPILRRSGRWKTA